MGFVTGEPERSLCLARDASPPCPCCPGRRMLSFQPGSRKTALGPASFRALMGRSDEVPQFLDNVYPFPRLGSTLYECQLSPINTPQFPALRAERPAVRREREDHDEDLCAGRIALCGSRPDPDRL